MPVVGFIFGMLVLYFYFICARSAFRITKGVFRMAFPKPEPKKVK